ncbi:MAG: glutathione S-transferase family protein [Pseudomonadales bacterium]|nr:glutathione S-transferase family protein [Pseudomonadales bacterium]
MITIWGGATARTVRAHWMCYELGLEYEPKLIGSRTGATQSEEFRALNAKEKIPVLVDDDFVISESAAIVTYLGDTYGPDTGLVPKPYTRERALYNQWLSFIQMELDAHTLYVMRKHRDLSDLYGEAPAAITTAIEGFQKQVSVADTELSNSDYLVANTFTGADLMMTTVLSWAKAYGVAITPRLDAYAKLHMSRPAYRTAAELNFSIRAGA